VGDGNIKEGGSGNAECGKKTKWEWGRGNYLNLEVGMRKSEKKSGAKGREHRAESMAQRV
jgi:hypothetical protein